ncbi:MAG: FAD-dependent monooxygenase [Bryobacteraceae bacterium]|nr:FAD-dependent monooxygenase [Bryobacteraceae bacterium]
MAPVRIVGAGPAGAAAALAAIGAGGEVEIFEKSPFPRHKVCGEFLSPGSVTLLRELGVWDRILSRGPARFDKVALFFGARVNRAALPETAYGFSRHAMDEILLLAAVERGAALRRMAAGSLSGPQVILATGRKATPPRGNRVFGFKAHFAGPQSDVMELYFSRGYSYVGVNAVEDGLTNVCGLASEEELRAVDFDIDEHLRRQGDALRQRLNPLGRRMKWLNIGPLVFQNKFAGDILSETYLAGDALSFVDPFTGSGILTALLTGTMAGRAAVQQSGAGEHIRACQRRLQRPFAMSSLFRGALKGGWGHFVGPWAPVSLLFRYTRP